MGSKEYFFANEDAATIFREASSTAARTRSRRGGAGRWKKISLAAVLLGAIAGAVSLVVRFALYDQRFRFASVHLQGSKFVASREVEEKFSPDKEKSVLRTPLERRLRQIEDIPWVRSATLQRVLPNQVWVTVRERTPIAFLRTADGLSLVDEAGVILESPKDASFHFPVVRGLAADEPAESRRAKMQLFIALMKDLDRGGLRSSDVISEVELEDSQDARIVVGDSSGAIVLHLGQDNFLARYLVYIGHIDEWKQKFPNIQSVDLRYDRQVVINAEPPKNPKAQKAKNPAPAALPPAASLRPKPPNSPVHQQRPL